MIYTVYVPATGTQHDVHPGSAIVGEQRGDMISTHIEGGGRADNIKTFEHRLLHAAGRRITRYPTSAIRGWREGEVVAVATTRRDTVTRQWVIDKMIDPETLQAWLGDEPLPAEGGSDDLLIEAAGRLFGQMTPKERAAIAAARLPQVAMAAEILAMRRRAMGETE